MRGLITTNNNSKFYEQYKLSIYSVARYSKVEVITAAAIASFRVSSITTRYSVCGTFVRKRTAGVRGPCTAVAALRYSIAAVRGRQILVAQMSPVHYS